MDATETGIYYSIIICGVFLILFVVVFIGSSTWLHRKFQKSQQLRLEAAVNAMEAERMRIAKDFHDDLGPGIYNVIRGLENLQSDNAGDLQNVQACSDQMQSLDRKIKRITRNLAPINLRERGLLYCLEELFINTQMEYGIEMDYAIGDLPKMDTEAETHIFRIMQEIVFNTVKHSGASKLRVKMETGKDGKVRIQTADNGCVQMDPKKAAGHGLENIKSRAVFLGGEACMNYVKGFKWHILIKSDTNKINENVPGE